MNFKYNVIFSSKETSFIGSSKLIWKREDNETREIKFKESALLRKFQTKKSH